MCERLYSLPVSRLWPVWHSVRCGCIWLSLLLLLVSTPSAIASEPNSAAASIERLNTHLLTLEQQVSELQSLLREHERLSAEQESSLLTWQQRHEALEQNFSTLSSTFEAQVSSIEAERDAEAARAARERWIGRAEGLGVGALASTLALTLVFMLR